MNKFFYGGTPYLMKDKILDYIPEEVMIKVLSDDDFYMRLKLSPVPEQYVFDNIQKYCGVECVTYYNSNDCILEVSLPVFDIIANRVMNHMSMDLQWQLEVVHNTYSGCERIGVILYDKEHPYGLKIAEALLDYLNTHENDLASMEYEELYLL